MNQEFTSIKNKVLKLAHEEGGKTQNLKVILKSLHVKYFQGFKLQLQVGHNKTFKALCDVIIVVMEALLPEFFK